LDLSGAYVVVACGKWVKKRISHGLILNYPKLCFSLHLTGSSDHRLQL
jgi:hypothetical protein